MAGQDGEHHQVLLVGVGPLAGPDGGAPAQGLGDVFGDHLGVVGDDHEGLVAVEGLDDAVHQHRLEHQAQQGAEAGGDVEDHQGGGGDEHVGAEEGHTHVQAGELLEDHGGDVGAAAGGVQVEEDAGPQGGEEDGEEELQDELIGEGARQGEDPLEDLDLQGVEDGAVDGAEAEALVQQEEAQQQEEEVDDAVVDRRREPGHGDELGQDDGQAGDAADGEVVGELEKVDAHRDQGDAEGHEEEFLDVFLGQPALLRHVRSAPVVDVNGDGVSAGPGWRPRRRSRGCRRSWARCPAATRRRR